MAAEYPSDDVEAFVHSGARVFDRYRVEELRAGCRAATHRGEIDVPGAADAAGRVVSDRERARCFAVSRFTQPTLGRLADLEIARSTGEFEIADKICGGSRRVEGAECGPTWSGDSHVRPRAYASRREGPEIVAQWRGHTDFDLLAWRAAMARSSTAVRFS